MSDFTCPKCTAKVQNTRSVGCPACGFGRPHHHSSNEQVRHPDQKPAVEAPPGFTGKLLTEEL
jgi:ribosomal protein L37E